MDEEVTPPQSREFAAKFERIFFMARLGRALRYQFDAVAREPLPGELQALVDQLGIAERK
jgi:hypothetical protein